MYLNKKTIPLFFEKRHFINEREGRLLKQQNVPRTKRKPLL